MRSFGSFVAALAVSVVLLLAGGATAGRHEEILSFKSLIHVNADAGLTVTETIRVRATGEQIKRGIYRDFPTTYKDRFGNTVGVGFRVEDVSRDGRKINHWVQSRSGGKRVYMGRKNVLIKPGVYTFALTYRTDRQIGFFEDYDEIYWNVTGSDWAFPIKRAEGVVIMPPKAHVVQKTAYTGPRGAKGKDFTSSTDAKGFVHFITTRTLKPGEGLTIAVAWPKGFVKEPTKSEKASRVARDNTPVLVGVVGFLLVLAYYLFAWSRVGRDPEAGTIVPLFEPPEGISPAAVNYIMKMGFRDKAFAAAVVSMAVKGHLRIDEDDGEFTLIRISEDDTSLAPGEKTLARKLFRYHPSIVLKQENHKSIGTAKDAFEEKLADELEKVYFLTNKLYLVPGALLTVLTVIVVAVFAGRTNNEAGLVLLFASLWLSFWTVGVYVIVRAAVVKWKLALSGFDLEKLGSALYISLFAVAFGIGEIIGIFMLAEGTSVLTTLIVLAVIGLLPLFYFLLKAPTMKGRRVLDRIEGFRMYLSVAEKERLEFLHPPDETPELFEKFLPYALALGVENEWSEHFAGVLAGAGRAAEGGYHPSWYSGDSFDSHGVSGFGDDLGGSLSNALSTSSTAPGSSSGSGGGGFSGGGGGGGGGGGF